MDVQTVVDQARDALTVRRVFGEPLERDGVTVIPAAKIRGGAGGGRGESPDGKASGQGTGFGLTARPVGAYVIRDGNVTWQPALDLNRAVLGGQLLGLAGLCVFWSLRRKKHRLKRMKLRRG